MSLVEELYDYDVLRRVPEPTAFIVRVDEPSIVLGSRQADDVLAPGALEGYVVRRRRGGGGAVFLDRDDLWVDFWIPADDPRHNDDVRAAAIDVGEWWVQTLMSVADRDWTLHRDGVTGPDEFLVACFAGRGPGEVFLDDRKVVGVTQWRVREGSLVSSVLKADSSVALLPALAHVPDGLTSALDHHDAITLGLLRDLHAIESALLSTEVSGSWRRRELLLIR